MDLLLVLFIHFAFVLELGISLGSGTKGGYSITLPNTLFRLYKHKSQLPKAFGKHLHDHSPSKSHTGLHKAKLLEVQPKKRDCTCPKAVYSFAVDSVCGNGGQCSCPPGRYIMTQDGCFVRPYAKCRCPLARYVVGVRTEDPLCDRNGGCHCPHTDTGWFSLTNNGCEYTAEYNGFYSGRYTYTGYNFRNFERHQFCHPNPCQNSGSCVQRYGGYDCICPAQYTGPHCEVDKCEKCDQYASCVQGHCRCLEGYEGNGYICEKEESCEDGCPVNYKCVANRCVCPPSTPC